MSDWRLCYVGLEGAVVPYEVLYDWMPRDWTDSQPIGRKGLLVLTTKTFVRFRTEGEVFDCGAPCRGHDTFPMKPVI